MPSLPPGSLFVWTFPNGDEAYSIDDPYALQQNDVQLDVYSSSNEPTDQLLATANVTPLALAPGDPLFFTRGGAIGLTNLGNVGLFSVQTAYSYGAVGDQILDDSATAT